MTENTPTAVTPVPDRKVLEAQLLRMEAEYPPPDIDGFNRDYDWFNTAANSGELDHLFGQLVAVYDGRVVRVGGHELIVRMELAREYDRHPQRFYISYHGDLLSPS